MPSAKELIKAYTRFKTLPHVAIRLTKLISDESASITQFEEVIRMDPTLAMRLLRMANSPYYGLKQTVDSISRALVYVGIKNLRNLVMVDALKDLFQNDSSDGLFSRSRLWLHSAAVGICSQMISERIFMQKGEDAFLCGLLHDIGLILEDQIAHDCFLESCHSWQEKRLPIVESENTIIGTNHCEVGYLLVQEWNFTTDVQNAIRRHHEVADVITPSDLLGVIQMSDYIVSKMNYPAIRDMEGILSPSLVDHIKENLAEYKVLSKDLPDEMQKAEDLYKK